VRNAAFLKVISVTAAAAAALASVTLSAAPAQARDGWNGAIAGGAAAGVVGGLAVGALLNRPRPVYVESEPVYVAPRPRYVPTCHFERHRVWLNSDEYTYRKVEVCD